MAARLPPIITQKPITKAMCFDLSNTLTKFRLSPGKALLQRMQTTIKMDELHGTKIPAISEHLKRTDVEDELTKQFFSVVQDVQQYWPSFGHQHHISMKLWWKNVIYNILNNVEFIKDPFSNLRQKTECLQIILPEDDAKDGFAKTDDIMVNVYDLDFPHNYIDFNFDGYFENLYKDFSDPTSYELFDDSRSFINFVFGHFCHSIVMGCATHDSFQCFEGVLEDLRMDYFDFVVTPQIAKCSKPNKRFYEVTKICIYDAIKQRMVDAEINKLYGTKKNYMPYDRSLRGDIMAKHGNDGAFTVQQQQIMEAYDDHFKNMLTDDDLDVIMVGNSLEKDVFPTLEMDWRAVWLLRPSRFEDVNERFDEYVEELNQEGIQHFGGKEWEQNVKKRVIVVTNLFDIHHNAFLW